MRAWWRSEEPWWSSEEAWWSIMEGVVDNSVEE